MSSRIHEVLGVLRILRTASSADSSVTDLRRRRMAATRIVASERKITPETVRDACTRQLHPHVRGIANFDALVLDWLRGDCAALRSALLHHTVDATDDAAVDRFFGGDIRGASED